MPKDNLIEQIPRRLKNNTFNSKHIKQLVQQRMQNQLFKIDDLEMTVLMFFVKNNQLKEVSDLLSNSSFDPLVTNEEKYNALIFAVIGAVSNPNYDIRIIDKLLEFHPLEQFASVSKIGSSLYIATCYNRIDLIQKLLAFDPILLLKDLPVLGLSPLHHACSVQSVELVDIFLKYEPEKQVMQEARDGGIPLHLALKQGELSIIKKLLQHVPEQQIRKKTRNNENVFDFALQSNNVELIEWLMTEYPEVLEFRSSSGATALHKLCHFGNVKLVRFILKNKPELRLISEILGMLPLHGACLFEKNEIIEELLKNKFLEQVLHVDKAGRNIFFVLCMKGLIYPLEFILQKLMSEKINIADIFCKKDKFHRSILDYLIEYYKKTNKPVFFEIMKIILKWEPAKQLIVTSGNQKATPLLLAAMQNLTDVVELFTSFDCPQQYLILDAEDFSPLLYALGNRKHMAKLLLEKGPHEQLDLRYHEMSPLSLVIKSGKDIELFKQMLAMHTESQIPNAMWLDSSILHACIATHNNDFVTAILDSKFCAHLINMHEKVQGNTPLQMAILARNFSMLSPLLEKGADIEAKNDSGYRPVHFAAAMNDQETLTLLIEKGVNFEAENSSKLTPLHLACEYGNFSAVELLVERGAAIEAKDARGRTPLFFAIYSGHIEIVEFLLEHKANPNEKIESNGHYFTPLMHAIVIMNIKMIEILWKYNVDPTQLISEKSSFTCLDLMYKFFYSSPNMYAKLQTLFPALPNLPDKKENKTSTSGKEEIELDFFSNDQQDESFSSRKYLLAIGYTPEMIEEFEEEKARNKKRFNQNPSAFQFSEKTPEKRVTWLKGNVSSDNEFIHTIDSPGSKKAYCYFDVENLCKQGCDADKIKSQRLKFDGYHIKKLDDAKGVYIERVRLLPNEAEIKIQYTHEVKITKADRVLLFAVEADESGATLYIGARYISGGFHSTAKISSFLTSNNNSTLEIKWPNTVQEKLELGSP